MSTLQRNSLNNAGYAQRLRLRLNRSAYKVLSTPQRNSLNQFVYAKRLRLRRNRSAYKALCQRRNATV
jgi:hypothetical protein